MEIINYFKIKINYKSIYNYQNYSYSYEVKHKLCKKNFIIIISKYKYIYYFFLISLFLSIYFYSSNNKNYFIKFKYYVNDCNNLKKYNNINVINKKNPYISVCIPVYNMEKYIEKSLLSIINQSFQDFEIIIANDNSKDNTLKIIERFQLQDKRIRIINHYKNLGVYFSRVDALLNSIGEYVLFLDPDDMLLNHYLFEELFNYNSKYNLDMIEFSVYHKEEDKKKIYFPKYHDFNHYHNFAKKIIYQPDLSNIIFYIPNTKIYTAIFCRTIWNKLVRKIILINTIEYIEKSFHNHYLITADDTPINMINFQFSYNYSNINLPGYLYNIRKKSMSRINIDNSHDLIVSYNFLLYFKLFYKYIKDFKKDLNFLYYDLNSNYYFILKLKDFNKTEYILKTIDFCNEIIKNNISSVFKEFIKNLIFQIVN